MGRLKGSGRGLVPLTLRVDVETYQALQEYGQTHDQSLAEAGRTVLRQALEASEDLEALPPEDAGYNEGLRRGLHDLRVAIHGATTKLWRR